jgi:acyl-CoA synthetase (AMP-forming)/AMP-acid ligase II
VSIEILLVNDGPLPRWSDALRAAPGEVGEIAVRAPQASASYFARPDADALTKIAVAGGGFFHRMGDLGRIDATGRLWFCGRKSERVETTEGRIATGPVEGVFDSHPSVTRSALVGTGPEGAQRPVVCIEREDGGPTAAALVASLRALAARHETTRGIDTFLVHPGFPVDTRHNAKIRRGELARWAEARLR